MKILLTGGSGMVGGNLKEFFEQHSDYTLYAPSSSELNLLNVEQVRDYIKKINPDFIIHCAGIVGGIQANIANPLKFLSENTLMGHNLVMTAFECGVKNFLNLGSSCMYPKHAHNPIKETDILTGSLEPTNEGYALAKIATAKLCEYISRMYPDFHYKTAIPCNLYGKYDHFDLQKSHMIPAAIVKVHQAQLNNTDVEIWGDGTARREFMYVEDLVDAIDFCIKNFNKMPVYLNIGLGYDYSIAEYYQAIAEMIGYQGKFVFDTTKPVGMKQKLVDISLLNDFGWKSKISLKEGLIKTYQFYLNKK